MSKLIIFLGLLISMPSFAVIEFGCRPLEPGWETVVEGAILKNENGGDQLAYYLTSEKWGAVDEYIESAQVQRSPGRIFISGTSASLEIDLNRTVGNIEGEHFGFLSIPGKNIKSEMYCVRGEF